PGVSKAFTKEGEGDGFDDLPPVDEWPAGVKNYLTPAGLAALKREIDALREAPRGDARRKLQLEQRLTALLARLEAAEVIDPAAQPRDVVRFGATVTVANDDGGRRRHRIVGVDEADPKRGLVSWRSPSARALTGRRVGDATTLHTPAGDEELTIVGIEYETGD
ncbi:MAG: GreA/GreB family elongation factor, partial [Polyangia bacterium]